MTYKPVPISQALSVTNTPLKGHTKRTRTLSTLQESWGYAWGTLETLLSTSSQRYTKIKRFNYQKDVDIDPDGAVSLITVASYPDNFQGSILYMWNNKSIPDEVQRKIKKFGMNQYFKSIPLKECYMSGETTQTKKNVLSIPTYYKYDLNVSEIGVVYSYHIPLMTSTPMPYPIVVFDIGIKFKSDLSNFLYFEDRLYDTVNTIIFNYQVNNMATNGSGDLLGGIKTLVDDINQFFRVAYTSPAPMYSTPFFNNQMKVNEESLLISAILSGYTQSSQTVCVTTSSKEIVNVMVLLSNFSIPLVPFYSSSIIRTSINPFLSIQFVKSASALKQTTFALPTCVVNLEVNTVKIINFEDITALYVKRANALLNEAIYSLKLVEQKLDAFCRVKTIAHCSLFDDAAFGMLKIEKKSKFDALFVIRRLEATLWYKAISAFYTLENYKSTSNTKLIGHLKDTLDVETEDLLVVLQFFREFNPPLLPFIQKILFHWFKHEEKVKNVFE
ncbi:hypothetical protein EIN_495300 [Entamoeba invadens IP1]|uniref:Uncharacterized protein n=1 Tax=Entamoeba invadens IP1 TaxID=370355 RepID=A0A0A1U304_ENTIV|nr:hypothetical protein EIN_495300 [Entamoeba invadens IP1]ELP87085.1 hypothetical protein EIN_495300 [Entamoeba invadens IP1]|eukprot:XP_004253856.1 hypothetical protein EIN_495300 [Entamoeba invadens IP1]